jgi:hypothetical protein
MIARSMSRGLSAGVAALALVAVAVMPASANSSSFNNGSCAATFSNTSTYGKTTVNTQCGNFGAAWGDYINGSPGLYNWSYSSLYSSSSYSSITWRRSAGGVDASRHAIYGGWYYTLYGV